MTPLSFQLYSARNFPLDTVLPMLAAIGYAQVEGFGGLASENGPNGLGGLYADAPRLKAALDGAGLAMPSGHMGLDLLQRPDLALPLARLLGIQTVVCPWLAPNQRPADAAGWRALGEKLAGLARPFQDAGLTFAYHNHDFEFEALPDGRYPMDVLLAAAPGIAAEVDIAWIVRGKADPFAWLERNGNRVVAVHLKDIAPEGQNAAEDGWADLGHGIVPWGRLLPLVKTGTGARYFIAEHDNPSDIKRFAQRSYTAARGLGA